jgi:hypothetical protein
MRKTNPSQNFLKLSIMVIILGFATLAGCEELFCGCPVDTPWTNASTTDCFQTQLECEVNAGGICYKCK